VTSEQALTAAIDALNAMRLPYMLVGSFSSNHYGVPRSTLDADFVLQLGDTDVGELARTLAPELRLDPQASFETITGTYRYVATAASVRFKLEFFLLTEDPYDQERFGRRVNTSFLGRSVFLPSAEDVVITKLRWSQRGRRQKDVADVKGVLAVQRGRLDWEYLTGWCGRHGTLDLLEELDRSIPPIE
jgi:hypothetical protein